ncbi:hypothetical protein Q3G72_015908 [Acer saccharum]|nr:hypothetical protein Q3G72_015908 [Acer saccharum]
MWREQLMGEQFCFIIDITALGHYRHHHHHRSRLSFISYSTCSALTHTSSSPPSMLASLRTASPRCSSVSEHDPELLFKREWAVVVMEGLGLMEMEGGWVFGKEVAGFGFGFDGGRGC